MRCAKCGKKGHHRLFCPQIEGHPHGGTLGAERHQSPQRPIWDQAVPARKPPEDIADYPAAAARVREQLGWSTDPDDPVVRTPFRERFKIPPRSESQLRALALQQVAESRSERHADLDDALGI